MATSIWFSIGSCNGFLPDGTTPLPEPVLTYHQWDPLPFFPVEVNLNTQDMICVWNLHIWNHSCISQLLMPWLLASPGHQHPWYWFCRISKIFSYMGKDLNYLWHVNVEEWCKLWYIFMFPVRNISCKGLTWPKKSQMGNSWCILILNQKSWIFSFGNGDGRCFLS